MPRSFVCVYTSLGLFENNITTFFSSPVEYIEEGSFWFTLFTPDNLSGLRLFCLILCIKFELYFFFFKERKKEASSLAKRRD